MRVLIFAAPFFPRKSGVGNYVVSLSKKLIEQGHEITVLCFDTENTGKFNENYQGIKVLRVKNKNLLGVYFWPDKKHLSEQLAKLDKKQFDLVITNTRFFHSSVVGMEYARKRNLQWIHVEHGSTLVQTNNPIIWLGSRIFDFTMGKKVLNNADRIVAISGGVEKFVRSISNNYKIIRIANGIETKGKKKPVKKGEVKNILFVGRLIYAKGVQDLIRAFSMLGGDYKLTIVGDGPYRRELEKLVKVFRLEKRVIFMGEKKREEVMKLYPKFDLFVNSSYSEGLPTSVLEAGLSGLPVIATDVGGTSDVIIGKRTGILIKEKDVEGLRKSLKLMIENKKLRERCATELQKKVLKEFSWEETIRKWERELKKIKN